MHEILSYQLRKILPDIPDDSDKCVALLQEKISKIKGVEQVNAHQNGGTASPGNLEIRFNSVLITRSELQKSVLEKGEWITHHIGHLTAQLAFINSEHDAQEIYLHLNQTEGICEARAGADGHVRIEFERNLHNEHSILKLLQQFDNKASIIHNCCNGHHHHHDGQKGHDKHNHPKESQKIPKKLSFEKVKAFLKDDTDLVFAIMSGVFLFTGWILGFLEAASDSVVLSLYVIAYFFGGFYTTQDVYHSLKQGKFDIHLLMLVAALGAASLGAWAEGALLLFLFSLGHSLEHYAMGKARKAISSLADLTPSTATVLKNGNPETIPVENLQIGEILLIKPGERAAADGFVIKGDSSMDQAPITGESVPVDKFPVENPDIYRMANLTIPEAHRIFAGSINGDGVLEVEVTAAATDSTLSRVIRMVQEAESQKSPTQRFAERFERWFVPAILVFVFMLLFAWAIIDEPFSGSFYRAMAVMVAASPCALAISTPSAILSGIARSARLGILIKGGAPLELLSDVDVIAFDKTGTLTEGKPIVTDSIPTKGTESKALINAAVAVERLIDHPIARAVVRDLGAGISQEHLPEIIQVKNISGKGVKAQTSIGEISLGNKSLFYDQLPEEINQIHDELAESGKTTMIVQQDGRFLGVIAVMDVARPSAKNIVAELREIGISHLLMISGDHDKVVHAIGKELGIDEALGGLLPQDKAHIIRELIRENKKVAMVGDGVNDAPAMAHASVGIAMGAAGSGVALETADVALMADDLNKLPLAIKMSKATRKIIKQNLFISLGMIAFLVPVTLTGIATMGIAVLFHEGSTLVVVLNALRLLRFKG